MFGALMILLDNKGKIAGLPKQMKLKLFIFIPIATLVATFLGAALWTGIHYTSEITNLFFSHKWKKLFQIVIDILLVLASIKVFMLPSNE